MNGFGNQDYSSIFKGIAQAKSMGSGGYAEKLGVGTHRIALKSYKVKDSTKGQGQFLEAEFVIVSSNTHKVGESRGWVWFINATGWSGAYEQDRAKKFLEAVGQSVGDDSPVEVIGGNLAGPDQAGMGLVLDVTVAPQGGKNAGKTNAKGEPYTNIYWRPVTQTIEEIGLMRAEIEALESASVQTPAAPQDTYKGHGGSGMGQATTAQTPTKGLGLFGRK
jgi:hypothetical protein